MCCVGGDMVILKSRYFFKAEKNQIFFWCGAYLHLFEGLLELQLEKIMNNSFLKRTGDTFDIF